MSTEINIDTKDKYCLTIEEASEYFHIGQNKYPPAKPVVFKRRAKPYVTSHASRGVGTV